jgi:CubicO group peptidase (beta-lactamase class C family)
MRHNADTINGDPTRKKTTRHVLLPSDIEFDTNSAWAIETLISPKMKDVTDPMRSKEQDSNGPLDARFDQLVTDTLQRWNVPGLSIAVVDEEKTWAKVRSKAP